MSICPQIEALSVRSRLTCAVKPGLHYLGFIAIGNLLWETGQLPLYTVWFRGSLRDRVVAALHCWSGDIVIAVACFSAALLFVGRGWPARRRKRVALLTIAFGVAYTVYSEWVNVVVRHAWAYSWLMPVLPPLGTGLSPLLQWLVIPPLAFFGALRLTTRAILQNRMNAGRDDIAARTAVS